MKIYFSLLFIFSIVSTFGQLNEIEKNVIEGHTDSLYIFYNKLDSTQSYQLKLRKVISGKDQPIYKDWAIFFDHVYEDNQIHPLDVLNFFHNNIQTPSDKSLINIDFVKLEWKLIRYLLETIVLDKAQLEQKVLEEYINQFNQDDPNYYRAIFYLNALPITFSTIKSKLEPGKSLCLKNKQIAIALKDTNLIVQANYMLSDFLILENDLMGYINLMEESLDLEEFRHKKSPYYYAVIGNLIDADIYAERDKLEIINLIELYSQDKYGYYDSYSYYIELLGTLNQEDTLSKYIFDKYEVENVEQLVTNLSDSAKQNLKSNDYHQFLRISAETLLKKRFYKSAFKYKDLDIQEIQYIYSQELSESIANYEIQIVKKQEENKLLIEKENGEILIFLLVGSILFIVMILFFIYLQYKKNKKLVTKNLQIEKQKQNIEEKNHKIELLMKEIHHRVKNNFQIISSLIELQTKGVDDEKALKLVKDGKSRVKAMALIHQKLYQNNSLTINFKEYSNNLIVDINKLFSSIKIQLNNNIDDQFELDIDTAIPLGLILNEIVTNAFKYAFNVQNYHELNINLAKKEDFNILTVSDNGKGMPINYDIDKSKSIGIKLMKNLAKQLHGKIEIENQSGLKIKLFFKKSQYWELVD